jgi:hypothetical protein
MEELSQVLARTNGKSNKFSSTREHLRQSLIESGCTFIIMNDTVKKEHSHGR